MYACALVCVDVQTWETCIFTSELRLTAYVLPTHIGVPATCEGTYIKGPHAVILQH